MKRTHSRKVYATLRQHFTATVLRALRFVPDGTRMVKRGAFRREVAEATSLDGRMWRVRPLEQGWKRI
jgi:hypothetical protein